MTARLISCLASTSALADLFSDASVLQAMLDVEAALARAEAAAGAIPARAAEAIAGAARAEAFDAGAIAAAALASATPVIPLVRALTGRVAAIDGESARYVHWGATSQDIADTALVLLMVRGRDLVRADHARITTVLRRLSDVHASSVMTGRTLLQPAAPITFGLKAAGWYSGAERGWTAVQRACDEAARVQCGGASGTLASLGPHGPRVARALAGELRLAPSPPWHADRGRLAAFVSACGIYTAALAKIARDISLLMQPEIGEVAERGGESSSMPQKRNPSACAVVLAAAARAPGVVSAYLGAMVQEHERGVGGWQAEWPIVAEAVQLMGAAAHALANGLETLDVFPERMRANLDATGGTIYSEAIALRLRAALGRDAADHLISEALDRTRAGTAFLDALTTSTEITALLSRDELQQLMRADAYLGAADEFRRALLAGDRAAK